MKLAKLLIAALVMTTTLTAQTATNNASAGFDALKSLAGEWEGKANMHGQEMPVTTSFRVVSDGSAILNLLGEGTPHEMVTMFHMDNGDLLATHYCSEHNQPRLRLSSGDSTVLNFDFKDATNLASPSAGHMAHVKFTILDANHHVEEWTFDNNGKIETNRLEFHRKSAAL